VYGLAKEYGDAVDAEIEDATTPENRERIRSEFGFKTHGLVIYGRDGTTILEKLNGHDLQEPQIRLALQQALDRQRAGDADSGSSAAGSGSP
jgi:hypothetical protein